MGEDEEESVAPTQTAGRPAHQEAVRGIRNVTGISCHISAALQLIHHGIPELRNELISLTDECSVSWPVSTNSSHANQDDEAATSSIEFVRQLGMLFKDLLSPGECNAVDPMALYNVLPPSLNYRDIGDAATALRAILATIRSGIGDMRKTQKIDNDMIAKVEKALLEGCLCGSTVQRVEGTKRSVRGNLSDGKGMKLIKRAKPDKERPLNIPFPIPVRGYNTLESALRSVTIEPQTISGYNWDLVTEFTETESDIGLVKSTSDDSSSSNSSSDEESEDISVSISASSDTSSSFSSSSSSSSSSEEEYGDDIDAWRTSKYALLKRLPPYLFFHLKRFEYKNGRVQKLSSVLDIPASFDAGLYSADSSSESDGRGIYALCGAIVHVDDLLESTDGTACDDGGHYISYVRLRSPETEDIGNQMEACSIDATFPQHKWIEINDESVKIILAPGLEGNASTDADEKLIEQHVLNILSGRYSTKKSESAGTKYATILLYSRKHGAI